MKLSTQGGLAVSDYFTPFDQASDAQKDTDLGSGGAVVLPDMVDANGRKRHLAVGAGKDSNIYLVDRDYMGKFNRGATSNGNIYQDLVNALPGGEWATAAYFNGAVYYGPVGGALRRFTFTQARLDPVPIAMTPTVFGYPGVTPSISSSGNNAGIVWAYENPSSGSNRAVLHAYNATDLKELYNSNKNPTRDQFGQANKFITPTICNGKVFVGTTNSVGVFGLLAGVPFLSLFGPADTPANVNWNDPRPVELGVKFHSAALGKVLGIRFYKGPSNTGPHVGSLWSAQGALLRQATFADETDSGWQQANFLEPVLLVPGATYIASYHTSGFYAATNNYFSGGHIKGPLSAPASGGSGGGNGVYNYGPTSTFPKASYYATNYWVDVAFIIEQRQPVQPERQSGQRD